MPTLQAGLRVVGLARPQEPLAFLALAFADGVPAACEQLRPHWAKQDGGSSHGVLATQRPRDVGCNSALFGGVDSLTRAVSAATVAWLREATAADASCNGGPAAPTPKPPLTYVAAYLQARLAEERAKR